MTKKEVIRLFEHLLRRSRDPEISAKRLLAEAARMLEMGGRPLQRQARVPKVKPAPEPLPVRGPVLDRHGRAIAIGDLVRHDLDACWDSGVSFHLGIPARVIDFAGRSSVVVELPKELGEKKHGIIPVFISGYLEVVDESDRVRLLRNESDEDEGGELDLGVEATP
jgi:hypothetical protein